MIDISALPSGLFRGWCGECRTVTIGRSAQLVNEARCACPPTRYDWLVELVCGMCERRIGDAILADPKAPILPRGYPRCLHCGGQAIRSGYSRKRYLGREPKLEPARRGRPPRSAA